jgi:hypothetical protein
MRPHANHRVHRRAVRVALELPCKRAALALLVLATFSLHLSTAFAQGTAFTYQGRFAENGVPYTGEAEFRATLWSVPAEGLAVASNSPVTIGISVSNGLFVLPLDFGDSFAGEERWLQLEVRTAPGAFTTLTPRQQLTPTPYAVAARSVTGPLPAAQLSGDIANERLSAGVSLLGQTIESAEIVDGSISLADVDAASFNGAFWMAGGNSGTTAGAHFLGTTDDQPLEIKVHGLRALRLEPNTNGAPNVIGGSPRNFVAAGVIGATIGGGGVTSFLGSSFTNKVTGNFSTVVGGRGNTASGNTSTAMGNETTASGSYSTATGSETIAGAFYSTAMGRKAQATHMGSFVWADSQGTPFASTADDQFSIRAANGVRIHNPVPGAELLVLETERPWVFRQLGSGASTALELATVDPSNPKPFVIQSVAVGIGTAFPTHLLHVDGVARSAQSTWATSSDRRAKQDITLLEGSLERLGRLRPVSFEYTPEYAAGRKGYEGRFTGFVAQDVEPVFPELVETVRETIGDRQLDDFRLLNTGGLTPHLVAAVQGLNRKVDEQRAELKQKEADLEELRRRLERLEGLIHAKKGNP